MGLVNDDFQHKDFNKRHTFLQTTLPNACVFKHFEYTNMLSNHATSSRRNDELFSHKLCSLAPMSTRIPCRYVKINVNGVDFNVVIKHGCFLTAQCISFTRNALIELDTMIHCLEIKSDLTSTKLMETWSCSITRNHWISSTV